jgi:hypothetical protein
MDDLALINDISKLDTLTLDHYSGMPVSRRNYLGRRKTGKTGRPELWGPGTPAKLTRAAYTRIVSDNVRSLLTADNKEIDRCLEGKTCIQARQIAARIILLCKNGNTEMIKIMFERVEGRLAVDAINAGSTNIQINIAPGFTAPKSIPTPQHIDKDEAIVSQCL